MRCRSTHPRGDHGAGWVWSGGGAVFADVHRGAVAINGNVTIITDERSIIGNVTNSVFTVT